MSTVINSIDTVSSLFSNRKISKKSLEKLHSKKEDGEPVYSILLNKSFSTNVVNYAHSLYSTVLNLKDSSKELGYFIDEYKTVEDKIDTLDESKKQTINEMFEERVNNFVDNYKSALNFTNKQKHSLPLLTFSSELSGIENEYSKVFESLGIKNSDNLVDIFDLSHLTESTNLNEKLEAIKSLANDIYSSTQNLLIKPMAEHMNFKDLNYYYNYKFDRYESNTFELIESGMIIDVVL